MRKPNSPEVQIKGDTDNVSWHLYQVVVSERSTAWHTAA